MKPGLHANDLQLERAILYAFHVWPWQHEQPFAGFPLEAFYSEKARAAFRAQADAHREHGTYSPGHVISRLRDAGEHETAAFYADVCVGANVDEGTWPPCHADLAIDRLLALYQQRERAAALKRYEAAVAGGQDEVEARLLMELHLDGIDSMRRHHETFTDEDAAELVAGGNTRPTGYSDLDAMSGGMPIAGLTVLAATASTGKSAFARGVIRERAKRGDRVYWYSQDQTLRQVMALEMMRLTRTAPTDLPKLPRERLLELARQVREDVWRERVTILDKPTSLANLMGFIRAARPDLVVVDYIQILDAGEEREYDNVTKASKALKTLALQLECCVLALAQFNRAAARGDGVTLAMLRASGQIEQDADQVWAIEREFLDKPEEHQPAVLRVLKNKVGPTGSVDLLWSPSRAAFALAATQRQQRMVEA